MPATAKLINIAPPITRDAIALGLKSAFTAAGYTTLVEDYAASATSDRILVYRLDLSAATRGTIFLENRITNTRVVNCRIATTYSTASHALGAIATVAQSTVTFIGTTQIRLTAIAHPEAPLVMMEQGTSTAQILGVVRPANKPAWWDENTHPYATIPQTNALTSWLPFPAANNPYNSAVNYPLLTISQLAAAAPNTLNDVMGGFAAIMSNTNKGYMGVFSNELALCSAPGLKRGDMLGEFLLLNTGTSALAIRSAVPTV